MQALQADPRSMVGPVPDVLYLQPVRSAESTSEAERVASYRVQLP